MNPDCSLVVAVYNRPDFLRMIFASCARQSASNFEIIIADDGSGPEINDVVRDAQKRLGLSVQHLWHEDRGWRKNVMLNNAIRAARSDLLIFTDGDCLPHRHFVADHLEAREDGRYFCGRRVETSASWTAALTMEDVACGRFERIDARMWWDGLLCHAKRVEDGLRFESPLLRNILHASGRGMLGSNFSVSREPMLAINGFDEEYDGPGFGEDSDVELRLELLGLTPKSLRHRAIQIHLHHPRTDVPQRCRDRYDSLRHEPRMRCVRGIDHLETTSQQDFS
ncbi:MAG: glycosyltransferase [Bacteroidetes bacterium]|nr:glycosyltransferase [Bacteroidota bacterium]